MGLGTNNSAVSSELTIQANSQRTTTQFGVQIQKQFRPWFAHALIVMLPTCLNIEVRIGEPKSLREKMAQALPHCAAFHKRARKFLVLGKTDGSNKVDAKNFPLPTVQCLSEIVCAYSLCY